MLTADLNNPGSPARRPQATDRPAGAQPHSERPGAVVSDLHLFTNRTTVHEHMHSIRQAAQECELFVFNGDIFDFQWSLHEGSAASVAAAERWIRRLAADHPETRLVFTLGNHDSIPAYREALARLSAELPAFEWRANWYRLDTKLFLHGDVCQAGGSDECLQAFRHRGNRKLGRSRLRHLCYWVFARSRLPAVGLRFINRETCARRILAYLQYELGDGLEGVRDIYFGHVHTPFADFRHGGLRFHNTGSATHGMRLRIIRFGY